MQQSYAENVGLVEDGLSNTNIMNHEFIEIDEVEVVRMTNLMKKRIEQTFIDVACICVLFFAIVLVHIYAEPVVRGFYCNDTDIFNPYMDDIVSFMVVVTFGTLWPLFCIIVIELFNSNIVKCFRKKIIIPASSRKQFAVSVSHAASLFILGLNLTLLITEIGKKLVGRLRPHFISVCQPNYSILNCTTTRNSNTIYNYIDTSGSFCTNSDKAVKEARLSFPSGHSSFSTYCMIFLIIYIQIRWRSIQTRFLKALIQIISFSAAYFTCLSRISDFHHRGSDVIGGVCIGLFFAVFVTKFVDQESLKMSNRKTTSIIR